MKSKENKCLIKKIKIYLKAQKRDSFLYIFVFFFVFGGVFGASLAGASDYRSDSFIVRDPVINDGGERATSTSFELYSTLDDFAIGESTSTSFTTRLGFLYWPIVSTPILSATAGDAQVSLSWTTPTASLGYSVGGYQVGQSTTSGSGYSYTNVASTSHTATGLTNNSTYYFIIRTLDAYDNVISTSTEASATPVASSVTPPPSGGGGGGFIPPPPPPAPAETAILFSGKAYPKSTVTLLQDARVVATTIAASDANFEIKLSGLSGGNYIYAIYSEDYKSRRSSILTFPVIITSGATTNITGIFIAPTITTDKVEVKRGEDVSIVGQSAPNADIIITVNSETEQYARTIAGSDGIYLYNFDTAVLELGEHSAKSKASIGNTLTSGFSTAIGFQVGTKTVDRKEEVRCGRADLNCDGRVDLLDFSIGAYWWKRALSENFAAIEAERLNADNRIDLIDFSIMAYNWTG